MGWTGKVKSNQEVKLCLSEVQCYVRLTPLNTTTELKWAQTGMVIHVCSILAFLNKKRMFLCVPTRVQTEYTDMRGDLKQNL